MDRLTAMEVFVKVVESGSFSQAAETLRLSRAMVSKHVQDLEDHLQSRLLIRTTRRLALTETGREYYQRCTRLLADLAEAEQLAGAMNAQPRGTLRITAPMSFGLGHLASAVSDFSALYPSVSVDLNLSDHYADLIGENYDLAIRIGMLEDSSLLARHLAPCKIVLCASPDYLHRRGTPGHPSELAHHECLHYTLRKQREWRFQTDHGLHSVAIRGPIQCNNGEALRIAALAGHGIILQPSFIVGPDLRAGRLIRLLPDYPPEGVDIYAVYPPGRHLSAKVRCFVDFMAQRFGQIPPWDQDQL